MIKRALISVANTEGIVSFAKLLTKLNFEIVTTQPLINLFCNAGIPSILVQEIPCCPLAPNAGQMMLHPNVLAGVSVDQNNTSQMTGLMRKAIKIFGIVIANSRPFADGTKIITGIDIIGPTLIRAAAMNFNSVVVVPSPFFYPTVMKQIHSKGNVNIKMRLELAMQAFHETAEYDNLIAGEFQTCILAGTQPVIRSSDAIKA